MSDLEQGFRLSEIFGIVRRRALVIVAFGILGAILGAYVFASAPSTRSLGGFTLMTWAPSWAAIWAA